MQQNSQETVLIKAAATLSLQGVPSVEVDENTTHVLSTILSQMCVLILKGMVSGRQQNFFELTSMHFSHDG